MNITFRNKILNKTVKTVKQSITHFLLFRHFLHSFGQKFTFPIGVNRDYLRWVCFNKSSFQWFVLFSSQFIWFSIGLVNCQFDLECYIIDDLKKRKCSKVIHPILGQKKVLENKSGLNYFTEWMINGVKMKSRSN